MTKKAAIALALIMLALVIWGMSLDSDSTRIVINGQELTGPLKGTVGAAGLIIGLIALFCAAILLIFVFAGIGIFVLGVVILASLVLTGVSFPILLIVLLPLATVWLFIAIARIADA